MKLKLLTRISTLLLTTAAIGQSTVIERTSPNAAAAQEFFFDRTSHNVTDRNWKIATLPASTASTGDKIQIELFGGSHGSSSTFQQTIHMGNRNSFYGSLRSTFGNPYQSVRIRAYQQTGGSIDVYLSLLANGWKGASVRIYEGSAINATRPTIYETPTNVGASPTGTLVFDSYTQTPGLVVKNNGNFGIGNINPAAKLDIVAPGVNGGEAISVYKVSDAPSDYLKVLNATGATGQFIPNVYGYHESANRQALYLTGAIGTGNDSGTEPIMVFDSRLSGAAVATRPLFSWDSYGNKKMTMAANGYLGIGTATPDMKLTVQGHVNVGGTANGTMKTRHINGKDHQSTGYGNLYLNYHTTYPVLIGTSANQSNLYVHGNVGVGTNNPDEKLTVNGKIHTNEVRVDLSVPGPDYVFEPEYELRSLEEIKKFVQAEKHLPEVPTAKEMEENGVELGEMNMLLLKKIEELTLHLIRMDEELKALKSDE